MYHVVFLRRLEQVYLSCGLLERAVVVSAGVPLDTLGRTHIHAV